MARDVSCSHVNTCRRMLHCGQSHCHRHVRTWIQVAPVVFCGILYESTGAHVTANRATKARQRLSLDVERPEKRGIHLPNFEQLNKELSLGGSRRDTVLAMVRCGVIPSRRMSLSQGILESTVTIAFSRGMQCTLSEISVQHGTRPGVGNGKFPDNEHEVTGRQQLDGLWLFSY